MSAVAIARHLEESFRPVLAAALGPGVALRCSSDEGQRGKPLPLPAVILFAKYLDRNLSIKSSGVYADDLEFRAECRVDGTAPQSAETAETLLASVKAAQAAAGNLIQGWKYLRMIPGKDEPSFDGATRVLTALWLSTALYGAAPSSQRGITFDSEQATFDTA